MGIRFACPNGHKLNVKEHLAGKRGICPNCGAKFEIPSTSTLPGGSQRLSFESAPSAPQMPSITPAPEMADPPVERIVIPAAQPTPASTTTPGAPVTTEEGAKATSGDKPPSPSPSPPPPSLPPEAPDSPANLVTDSASIKISSEVDTVAQYVAHRRRSRKTQTSLAIALLAMVILLAIVLIWVLNRDPVASEPAQGASPRATSVSKCRASQFDFPSPWRHVI